MTAVSDEFTSLMAQITPSESWSEGARASAMRIAIAAVPRLVDEIRELRVRVGKLTELPRVDPRSRVPQREGGGR